MGDFIDVTQFSAAVSSIGLFLIIAVFRVRPSKSWESSSSLKKTLFLTMGLLLQIPVVIAIVCKPDIVTDTLTTEPWTWKNLLINYLAILGVCIVVYIISLKTGGYDASKH